MTSYVLLKEFISSVETLAVQCQARLKLFRSRASALLEQNDELKTPRKNYFFPIASLSIRNS